MSVNLGSIKMLPGTKGKVVKVNRTLTKKEYVVKFDLCTLTLNSSQIREV